ncbi:MAG: hypothetical protein KGN00_07265 [Chloroflexota bacterium]|nr:hypothetical protein [Chloroflexota bacterium]
MDGPVTTGDPTTMFGGDYGPYMLERFTTVDAATLDLQYLLSTWNPYTVVRMRTVLRIRR